MKFVVSQYYYRSLIAILAITVLSPQPAFGTDSDSTLLANIEDSTSPITQLGTLAFDINPAASTYRHDYSLGSMRISADYLHQDNPVVVQDGTGHMTGAFSVDSYMHLRNNTTVWGGAEYRAGQYRNIKWNNTLDYSLVSPYVIGDSVGGDIQSRSYSFNGGYAGKKGYWSWGAQASYRANIAYRNRDPRVKVIVSDLDIDMGGTYRLPNNYIVGLSGGLRIYIQESDIEFYNPINNIQTYAMTGIGTTYARFSGTSTESTSYSGIGYHAALQVLSHKSIGWRLSADYNYMHINQILRDYNNLTLSYTGTHRLTGQLSYAAQCANRVTIGAQLDANWQRRLGTENLFGTAIGNSYERISSKTYYYNDIVTSQLSIPIQLDLHTWHVYITPGLSFDYNHENFRKPSRDLECHGYSYGLKLEGHWKMRHTLVRIGGSGALSQRSLDSQILTGLNENSSIAQMVHRNFTMQYVDRSMATAFIGIDHAISSSMTIFTEIKYAIIHFAEDNGNSNGLIASIGAKF